MDKTEPKYGNEQSLFPIVQGSVYPELRKQSAEYIASKTADGYAIGGLSVGEPHEDMYAMTDLVCGILPKTNHAINGCWHPGQHIRMYQSWVLTCLIVLCQHAMPETVSCLPKRVS